MKIILPGQNEPISIGGGPVNPTWYEKLKFLEKLQPLSDIVFPAPPTPTTIDGAGPGAFTLGYGLSRSTWALSASLSRFTNSLGADVALNNTANYFDGPSVAQGTTGTWLVSGAVQLSNTATAINVNLKLWDGTTVISSARAAIPGAGGCISVTLSGIITNPAGNLRISVNDPTTTTSVIKFNHSGNSKDSTLSAVRIA